MNPLRNRSLVTGLVGAVVVSAASISIASRNDSPAIDAQVVEQTAKYASWECVSDRLGWAAMLCNPPTHIESDWSPLMSKSEDEDTHGRKMYHLFAKDSDAYRAIGTVHHASGTAVATPPQPVGQIIVKESWYPIEIAAGDVEWSPENESGTKVAGPEFIARDGQWYKKGSKGPLFVMMKTGEIDTPNTDRGWIYATLTPDGGEVTAAGLIASCMECHAEAPHDRLFGLRNH